LQGQIYLILQKPFIFNDFNLVAGWLQGRGFWLQGHFPILLFFSLLQNQEISNQTQTAIFRVALDLRHVFRKKAIFHKKNNNFHNKNLNKINSQSY